MNSKGLSLFLQNAPITGEQLYQLLEIRKEAILTVIETVKLHPLKGLIPKDEGNVEWIGNFIFHGHGDFECIYQGSNTEPTEISPGRFDVGPPGDTHEERWPGHEKHFWGLTQRGTWLHIAVGYYRPPNQQVFPRYARVNEADTAKELCEKAHVPPRDVLGHLYRMTLDWAEAKRQLLREFEKLESSMEVENAILRLKIG